MALVVKCSTVQMVLTLPFFLDLWLVQTPGDTAYERKCFAHAILRIHGSPLPLATLGTPFKLVRNLEASTLGLRYSATLSIRAQNRL
jgi:hypothetical protein